MESSQILMSFLRNIQEAKNVDRDTVIMELISKRLEKCTDIYIKTLTKDLDYLKARNEIKLIRKLTK